MKLARCPFCRSDRIRAFARKSAECLTCGAKGPRDNSPHDTGAELWNDQLPWWATGPAKFLAACLGGVLLWAIHMGLE